MFEGPEKKFQKHIADFVIREHGFAVLTQEDITDTEFYFAEDHLYAFLKATQSETLERLEVDYGSDSRDEIFKALREEIGRRPLWSIIRTGLSVRGHDFKLYFPKPRSSESVANQLYGENRITFIPELLIQGAKRPDFGFFLNGLPIVTMELKHEANQNVHDAVAQYVARDHSDRIFQLPFLHIAADTADVQVATNPRTEKNFRWFNTGLSNQPQTAGEYPVEFLYREVLSKDSLLEAVSYYLVQAPKQEAAEDRPERPAFTLFPRYHQRRCVEKIAGETQRHFAEHGDVGRKFLVNHSAGSGKTLTMCWLADRLHSLYKPGTSEKMVNMVFLLTDRKSLDKNIREDIEKFSHLKDVVRYAKRSGDLGRFLRDREQIIVTTQQKFHYILDKIANDEGLKDLRVAFLIFEEQVKPLIEGRAKAMIVTTSRIAGLEYFRVIQRKLKERGADYKALYAFSDFVHPDNNEVFTEHAVNGLNDGELIEDRFEEESYRFMIVASKFQTGFDQPLLAGMFLDKAVADRNAVQTISRLNRCHPDKDGVVVVDFTNNAKAILKAFNKYRHGSPHEPDEPDSQKCLDLYEEILAVGLFTQKDAPPVVELIKATNDANLQTRANELRQRFQAHITDPEDRKSFVYLLAKFVKSYHFLSSFFSYEEAVKEFVAFCEFIGPQLIKAGSVSELMKMVRATVVKKAAVTYEGEVEMPGGLKKPKAQKGGGGGAPPVKKISVQDMITKIRETFDISDDEALHIREVSEEKLEDESIRQTVAAHKTDFTFLENVFKGQVNSGIQDAYALRALFEQLGDPKYTDKGAIFDIMAYTVIQKGLELEAAS